MQLDVNLNTVTVTFGSEQVLYFINLKICLAVGVPIGRSKNEFFLSFVQSSLYEASTLTVASRTCKYHTIEPISNLTEIICCIKKH